jgi:hypothetical protein
MKAIKLSEVLISTLFGGIALFAVVFLMSLFDKYLWDELTKDGVFYIFYLLIMVLPFLLVLFFIISVVARLVQRLNIKIPLILVPFLITISGLTMGSLNEHYFFELRTLSYFIISSIIVSLCSLPIINKKKI